MVFAAAHWQALRRDGYTVVSGAVGARGLRAAQEAADRLNAQFPEGWERSKNESWREIRYCRDPAFMTLVSEVLDPLALEILESAPPVDFVQLAATFPGFATKGGVGRNFHVDAGQQPALDVFNVLMGVALTDVDSDTAGSFHVLPRSHEMFAGLFRAQPEGAAVHWGEVKLEGQRRFRAGARATPSDAILPPEPGLLSTMNCWENCSVSDCAISRARMSIAWPAAKPTTRRTGCAGKVCADACRATAGTVRAPAAKR